MGTRGMWHGKCRVQALSIYLSLNSQLSKPEDWMFRKHAVVVVNVSFFLRYIILIMTELEIGHFNNYIL